MKKGESLSLRQMLIKSWGWPACIAFLSGTGLFFVFAWADYNRDTQLQALEIRQQLENASRAVSAELLLGESGNVESVTKGLREKHGFPVRVVLEKLVCSTKASFCHEGIDGKTVYRKELTDSSGEDGYIEAIFPKKPFHKYLNLRLLFISVFPVFVFFFLGVFIQLRFWDKKLISPAKLLVKAAESKVDVEENWPLELRKIGEDLQDSFQKRNEVILAGLTRGVIHDIKTLLHSPMVASELVAEAKTAEMKVKRLESLHETTRKNLSKVREVISRTLDGSKEFSVNPSSTDIGATIFGAVDGLKPFLEKEGIDIVVSSSLNTPLPHDSVHMNRVFTNVIKNAAEAAVARDRLSAKIRIAVSESEAEGLNGVFVSVEDSGVGFKKDQEKFVPWLSTKTYGTGLGLYISSKIVRKHGGNIKVESSKKLGGALVKIFLPLSGVEYV